MNPEVRSYVALTSAQALRIPINLVSVALLARLLGPEGMGDWAMALGASALLHSALLNWMQAPNVRFGREEWVAHGTLRRTWASRWPFLAVGFTAVVLLLALQPGHWLQAVFGLSGTWAPIVALYTASLWLQAEAQGLLQATGRLIRLAVVGWIAGLLTCGVFAVLFLAGPGRKPAALAVALSAAALALSWGVTGLIEFFASRSPGSAPTRAELARSARYAWPMLPGFLLGEVSNWGDHVLVRALLSVREVGLFQAAYQTMLVSRMLATPLTTVFLPALVGRAVSDPDANRTYLSRVVPSVMALWFLFTVPFLALLPEAFHWIMGDRFREALPLLGILSVSVPGAVATQLYTVLFSVQGRLGRQVAYHALMTSLNLAVSIALIPVIGVQGSAVGTTVGYLLSQWLYVRDQHQVVGVPARRAMALLAGLVAYAALVAAVLDKPILRFGLGAAAVLALVAAIRRWELVDGAVLDRCLPRRPERWRRFATTLLVTGA